jgi:hypothetical protein
MSTDGRGIEPIPGSCSRQSGLTFGPIEGELIGVPDGSRTSIQESIDALSVHEVPMIGTVGRHKPIEIAPRNPLQKIVENAILVPHGVAPLSCPGDAPTSEHK